MKYPRNSISLDISLCGTGFGFTGVGVGGGFWVRPGRRKGLGTLTALIPLGEMNRLVKITKTSMCNRVDTGLISHNQVSKARAHKAECIQEKTR